MTRVSRWTMILVFVLLAAFSSASGSTELEEHLSFLEPLTGLNWEGGYIGDDAPDLVITLRFEPILNGMAVKYTREAAGADFLSETHFYWDPARDEVLFISLNNRGIVGEGVVILQDGNIILRGQNHWPGGSSEFETVLQIDPKGVLKDTFNRIKEGEWVQGHYQEFTAKE